MLFLHLKEQREQRTMIGYLKSKWRTNKSTIKSLTIILFIGIIIGSVSIMSMQSASPQNDRNLQAAGDAEIDAAALASYLRADFEKPSLRLDTNFLHDMLHAQAANAAHPAAANSSPQPKPSPVIVEFTITVTCPNKISAAPIASMPGGFTLPSWANTESSIPVDGEISFEEARISRDTTQLIRQIGGLISDKYSFQTETASVRSMIDIISRDLSPDVMTGLTLHIDRVISSIHFSETIATVQVQFIFSLA